jgi:phage shock protein A
VGIDTAEVRGYKAGVPLHEPTPALLERIAELEALLSAERERIVQLEKEREVLRASHERLRLEVELLKRRLFVAKPRASSRKEVRTRRRSASLQGAGT